MERGYFLSHFLASSLNKTRNRKPHQQFLVTLGTEGLYSMETHKTKSLVLAKPGHRSSRSANTINQRAIPNHHPVSSSKAVLMWTHKYLAKPTGKSRHCNSRSEKDGLVGIKGLVVLFGDVQSRSLEDRPPAWRRQESSQNQCASFLRQTLPVLESLRSDRWCRTSDVVLHACEH